MIADFLFIKETEHKGRGIFTKTDIDTDMIIEVSPVIVLSKEDRQLIDKTLLHDYIFEWEEDTCCMALGWLPLYNHSSASNCEYFMNYEEKTIFIKSVRKIKAGEEITINYNGDWDDKRNVWFEVKH